MPWIRNIISTETCVIELDHVPKKERPRYDRRHDRMYTPSTTVKDERLIRYQWLRQIGDVHKDHAGEVRLFASICRPLSKSNPKYWDGRADLGKPDSDNVDKLIRDALNGIAYQDDRQITQSRIVRLPRSSYGKKAILRIHIQYFDEKYEK